MVVCAKGNRRSAVDRPAGRIEFGHEVLEERCDLHWKENNWELCRFGSGSLVAKEQVGFPWVPSHTENMRR